MTLTFTILHFDKTDTTGESIAFDGCEVPQVVSVTRGFKQGWMNRLGHARLTKLPDKVVAQWEWPGGDKLPDVALYPAIEGRVDQREGKCITKCKIMSIGIAASPNQDQSILSLQEQNPLVPINWEGESRTLIKKTALAADEVDVPTPQSHAAPPPQSGSD